jgi:ribosomal protein L30/L7E
MSIKALTLESLKDLDYGKAHLAFQAHLARAAQDCLDRPGDSKARTVTLSIGLVPVLESDLDCTEVKAQIQVTSKVPVHRTKVYSLGLRRNGGLVFSEDSPEAIDQATFFDGEPDAGGE